MKSRTPSKSMTTAHGSVRAAPVGAICGDAILERMGVGVVVVNAAGAIQYRNAFAGEVLSAGNDLEAAFAHVRWGGSFDGWARELSRLGKRDAMLRLTGLRTGDRDQSAETIHVRLSLLDCEGGNEPQYVLLVERSTTPEEADEQVEVARRLASLGKLAARVAHELNNPLDGILRYINLSLRIAADTPEPKLQSYLSESRTGLMRMIQIIGDLLQFSRTSDAGFESLGVNEVIDEAIRAHAATADRHRVIVAADYQGESMPAVRGSRLYQVCCNLIRNAIDAMPDGGRLTITSGMVDGDVVVRVADTGVGLPEPIERVFEPFFTTKLPGKGTGLGLAICKDFVENMGGTITAAQGVERGAVFTVRVPIVGFTGPKSFKSSERTLAN